MRYTTRYLTLLFLCAALLLRVSPSEAQTGFPPLYYGIFEDSGMVSGAGDFTDMILDLQSRNFNAIMFTNSTPNLQPADDLGMNIVAAPMGVLFDSWYRNDAAPANIETARAIVGPVIDALRVHPSVIGYNLLDDAVPTFNDKLRLSVDVIRERDPSRAASPMMIRYRTGQEVYSVVQPNTFLMYYYPVRNLSAHCDFYNDSALNWVDTIRVTSQERAAHVPLWLVLQTHSTTEGPNDTDPGRLRQPTVEEVRLQNWLALGEDAKGIFWFVYSTLSDQPWIGLKDNPELYAETTDLAARVDTLRPVLEATTKIADRFYATGSQGAQHPQGPYTSTLYDPAADTYYALVVNQSCTEQTLQIDSAYFGGQLRDVETGVLHAMGTALPFRGGDGRLFELIDKSRKNLPAVQANLVLNASFEADNDNDGKPDVWSRDDLAYGDKSVAYDGQASLRVSGTGDVAINLAGLQPNTRYYLSYRVRGENFSDSSLGVHVIKTNSPVKYLSTTIWKHSGSYDWTKRVAFFRTPADYQTGRLDIAWNGIGQAGWIDDIVLCMEGQPCEDEYRIEFTPALIGDTPTPTPTEAVATSTVTPTATSTLETPTTPGTQTATPTATLTVTETPIPDEETPTPTPTTTSPVDVVELTRIAPENGATITQRAEYVSRFQWVPHPQATWYHVYIATPDNTTVVFNKWYPAAGLCTADLCTLTDDVWVPQNGAYLWWIGYWNEGMGQHYAHTYQSSSFNVSLPFPMQIDVVYPTSEMTEPMLQWVDNPDVLWYRIWFGPQDYTTTLLNMWYPASVLCEAGQCRLDLPDTYPPGAYEWWMELWSPGGYQPWMKVSSFSIQG